MSKPLISTPKSSNKNRNIGITVGAIIIALIAVAAGFCVFKGSGSTGGPHQIATPHPSPTSTFVTNKIQVSGTVDYRGLEIQPTQIQFMDTSANLMYTAMVQNGFYNISLPNQQIYGVVGTWGGRTFNAAGIPIGAIDMGTLHLNAGVGVTSITQDLPTLTPTPIN